MDTHTPTFCTLDSSNTVDRQALCKAKPRQTCHGPSSRPVEFGGQVNVAAPPAPAFAVASAGKTLTGLEWVLLGQLSLNSESVPHRSQPLCCHKMRNPLPVTPLQSPTCLYPQAGILDMRTDATGVRPTYTQNQSVTGESFGVCPPPPTPPPHVLS